MAASRPPRIPVRCPVQFTHEEGVTGAGTLFNLSFGGCAVHSTVPVSDGMLITLQFPSRENDPPISIEMARVRWATMQEFGVEFLMVLRKERKKLDRLLRAIASNSIIPDVTPSQAA